MMKKNCAIAKLAVDVFGTDLKFIRALFPLHIILKLLSATVPLVNIYVFSTILKLLLEKPVDSEGVLRFTLLFLLMTGLSQILGIVNTILEMKINLKIKQKTQVEFNRLVGSFSLSYIDSPKGKNDIQLLSVSYDFYGQVYYGMLNIVSCVYVFFVSFYELVQCHFLLALAIILLSLPIIIYSYKNQKEDNDLEVQQSPTYVLKDNYLNMLTSAPYAMDVRLYNIQEVFKEKYLSLSKKVKKLIKNMYKRRLVWGFVFQAVLLTGQIALVCCLLAQTYRGRLSVSELTRLTGYIASAITAMITCGAVITDVITKLLWIDEYSVSKRDKEAVSDSRGETEIHAVESIEFVDVWFKYPGTDKDVLKGVSFRLDQGEKTSIVGVNGVGKTTCIKLLLGIYKPDKGRILLNDISIDRFTEKSLHQMFSCVFQNYIVYPFSLRENIKFGALETPDYDAALMEFIKQSGSHKFFDQLKYGFETALSRRFDSDGVELSKGQKQSVVIARALYKNAPVMIFDEPSSALDPENENELLKIYETLNNKQFGILISHRLSSSAISDRILLLDDARIKETGTHQELMALGGMYYQMYTTQKNQYGA